MLCRIRWMNPVNNLFFYIKFVVKKIQGRSSAILIPALGRSKKSSFLNYSISNRSISCSLSNWSAFATRSNVRTEVLISPFSKRLIWVRLVLELKASLSWDRPALFLYFFIFFRAFSWERFPQLWVSFPRIACNNIKIRECSFWHIFAYILIIP